MRFLQAFSLPSLNFRQSRGAGLLAVLLLSLLAVGCGSSSGGGFVADPGQGGGNNPSTGSVTFNFVRAQSAIVVPVSTINLRFEFFSGLNGDGALVYRTNNAFAQSVTIANVPTSARSAVVTALDADGFPISEFNVNVNVTSGGNTVVNSATGTSVPVELTGIVATPVSLSLALGGSAQLSVTAQFSNGDQVPLVGDLLDEVTFVTSDTSVVEVGPESGNVRAVLTGTALVTASFRGFDAAVPVQVNTGGGQPPTTSNFVATPSTVTLAQGTQSEPIVLTATFDDGTTRQVAAAQGVTFVSNVSGITVDSNQRIVVGPSVPANTVGTVTFQFLGRTVSVTVNVNSARLNSIAIEPATVSLPFGGFEREVIVRGNYSNGTVLALAPTAYTLSENSNLFSIVNNSRIVTAASGTAGTATLTASATTADGTQTATANVSVGLVNVVSLTVSPASPLLLSSGEFADVTVTANLSDGTSVDVTNFAALTRTTNNDDSVIRGARVVGVTPGASTTVTFTLPGSGANGVDRTANLVVTVEQLELTSARFLFAGNEIGGDGGQGSNSLNLPRGYVGIFEVEGTFSNGTTRRLRPNEYRVEKLAEGVGEEALPLFKVAEAGLGETTFAITQVQSTYTDLQPVGGGAITSDTAVVDDIIGGGPRQVVSAAGTASDDRQIAIRPTFRAVAADWRRGDANRPGFRGVQDIIAVGGAFVAPLSTDNFVIVIDDSIPLAEDFPIFGGEQAGSREVSVTITDPPNVSVTSVAFLNYPNDPNIPVGTGREIEVRVSFPEVSGNSVASKVGAADVATLPPSVNAQGNFKLAEANLRFETDADNAGGANRNVLYHLPTELGLPAITSETPYDVGAIEVAVTPLGGIAIRPVVVDGPTVEDDTYTAGTYDYVYDVYGPSTTIAGFEDPNIGTPANPVFDPGPDSDPASERKNRAPFDNLVISNTRFDNGSAGFVITFPTVFTLKPSFPNGTTTLEVGETLTFATMIQFQDQAIAGDYSLDYPPTLFVSPTTPAAVGLVDRTSGNLTVSGINDQGATVTQFGVTAEAIVAALDVEGNAIPAAGTIADPTGMMQAARAVIGINVTPLP